MTLTIKCKHLCQEEQYCRRSCDLWQPCGSRIFYTCVW